MDYFVHLLKKAIKSLIVTTILILILWGALYKQTDFETVAIYFGISVAVCVLNTLIANWGKHKIENLLYVQSSWVVMAGVVLVLYHSGFVFASVFAAAAIFASPFFWATVYEGIVGFSLLITLACLIS